MALKPGRLCVCGHYKSYHLNGGFTKKTAGHCEECDCTNYVFRMRIETAKLSLPPVRDCEVSLAQSRIAGTSCPNCHNPVGFFTDRMPSTRAHYCTVCGKGVTVYA